MKQAVCHGDSSSMMWLSTTWCDFSVSPLWHGDDVTFPAPPDVTKKSMVPPYWEKGCWGVRHPFGKSSPLSWCGSYINARAMKNMGLSKKLGTPLQKTCACSIPHCWYPPFLDPCVSGGLMRMGHDIRQKPKKTSRMIPPLSQHYPNDIPIVIIIFPWYFHFFPPCTHYYPHDIPMPHFFYALWVGPGPSLGLRLEETHRARDRGAAAEVSCPRRLTWTNEHCIVLNFVVNILWFIDVNSG